MKFYVYYNDDFYEMGGVDLMTFPTERSALDFINDRLSQNSKRTLANYVLIKGEEAKFKVVEFVTKLETDGYE